MKVYSIGREVGCDIVINDSTDVISRRHAVLNVTSTGKMTIIDQSHNGTYVNGIRISSNVPFPVSRKDNISFAHVARLDWNLVPKPISPLKYVAIAIVALLIIGGGFWGFNSMNQDDPTPVADTTKVKQKTEEQIRVELQDSLKKVQAKQDSIAKVKRDSIEKVRRDSIKKINKPQPPQPVKPKRDTTKTKPTKVFR